LPFFFAAVEVFSADVEDEDEEGASAVYPTATALATSTVAVSAASGVRSVLGAEPMSSY
jgi:tetrahydromethanopterin S-methyltransferase subunit D